MVQRVGGIYGTTNPVYSRPFSQFINVFKVFNCVNRTALNIVLLKHEIPLQEQKRNCAENVNPSSTWVILPKSFEVSNKSL